MKKRTLFADPGALVGSPSVSHDGRNILFSVVPSGERFWCVAMLSLTNHAVKVLASGPFHDFDPEPLPDGRVVFSSTHIGNREEYHGKMARSLFVMNSDGSNIKGCIAAERSGASKYAHG